MTLPIRVGPSTVTINRDDRFLVCQPDGRIAEPAEEGFFARDTRFVSGWDLFINGRRPVLLNSSPIEFYSARFEFTNDGADRRPGPGRAPLPGDPPGPHDRRRHPRGLRPRQLRPASRAPHDRGRHRLRLRRHLRRQGRDALAPARRDQQSLVPLAPRAAHDLRQPRVPARAAAGGRPRRFTAAVRQRPARLRRHRSSQRAPGTPACAGCRSPPECAAARRRCHATRSPGRRGRGQAAASQGDAETANNTVVRAWDQAVRDHGGAAARGPAVRARRLHPGGRRAVVRDALRARCAGRLDAGHLRLPRVRGRRPPPARPAAGHGRRSRSATWSPARSRTRSATASWRSSGSCRTSRTTARTTRRASSSSCWHTTSTGWAIRTWSAATCPTPRRP